MASTDALPVPQKNVAYRVTFPILDADGDLVTGATGLDSEISKDGGTAVDCTNEATEIATATGMYFLDLTSTEMNADTVAIIVKTTSSGAKTTPIVMYPAENGDIKVNVTQYLGAAAPALVSSRYDASVGAIASGAVTATSIASDAITAAKIAADAITAAKIADGAIDDAAVSTDMDAYHAKVWVIKESTTSDHYAVGFFKNGQPVTSGITSPTIQVIKASDASDLIASGALTQIGSTGLYKKDESTNKMTAGQIYFAKVEATIDSSTRTWFQQIGRDSA